MLCGVTATLGSNPSATATAARPHWGRAVLLCLRGVLCRCVAVWPHRCSGRRRPRPPARLGILTSLCAAPRSPPVPSGALHACHTNFACNSLVTISNVEFIALKSQRFQTLLNLHPIELHATFGEARDPPPPTVTAARPAPRSPPVRVRNWRLWCIFRAQRCRRFQRLAWSGFVDRVF